MKPSLFLVTEPQNVRQCAGLLVALEPRFFGEGSVVFSVLSQFIVLCLD